jgi:hypothetical protein
MRTLSRPPGDSANDAAMIAGFDMRRNSPKVLVWYNAGGKLQATSGKLQATGASDNVQPVACDLKPATCNLKLAA